MIPTLHSIALNAHSEFRLFFIDLAARLKRDYGAKVHLYYQTEQERVFYRSHGAADVFESMARGLDPLDAYNAPVPEESAVIRLAREYESRIGCTYNTLAVGNRHFGRGYSLAGFRHPRSRQSEHTSYLQMVNAYNQAFAFWDREIRDKGLTLIVSGNKPIARAALANGIPFRGLAGARFRNLHFWSPNEFFENPAVEAVYEKTAADQPIDLAESYFSHRKLSRQYFRSSSFIGMTRKVAVHAARRAYWTLRGYEKAKGYFATDELRMLMRRWRDGRRMTGGRTAALAELKEDSPFVFFPLHTEPEASVGQFSPEYFYQHAAIAALSRDLPAGITLVVKETVYGVGRRPADFYDQILALKNVVMLNMREPGIEVVRRATAVATITGTAGFEAAVMGTPVVTFGRHNIYNFLPHVFVVEDETGLKDHLRAIFDGSVDLATAKIDGARYLRAITETSFDMGNYVPLEPRSYGEAEVTRAARALAGSLDPLPGSAEGLDRRSA